MPKTMSANSAFARLMRDADPSSLANQKLIEAANVAADELCQRIREARWILMRERVDTKPDQWEEYLLSDKWSLAQSPIGKLVLIYEAGPDEYCFYYGDGHCKDIAEARFIGHDIHAAGGKNTWIGTLLKEIEKRYNTHQE